MSGVARLFPNGEWPSSAPTVCHWITHGEIRDSRDGVFVLGTFYEGGYTVDLDALGSRQGGLVRGVWSGWFAGLAPDESERGRIRAWFRGGTMINDHGGNHAFPPESEWTLPVDQFVVVG